MKDYLSIYTMYSIYCGLGCFISIILIGIISHSITLLYLTYKEYKESKKMKRKPKKEKKYRKL